ncbi:MAG: inositol monophosphatase [Desulfovibrio sp.]|nr:inositol monophosphatase [Desulfovibrio sp.]
MIPENYSSLLESALPVIKKAGEIISDAWNQPRTTRHKGAIDLVTETDLAVQAFLKDELSRLLPDAGFVGEEGDDEKNVDQELAWIVDPVDGTTNFVHKIPMVAVSVALARRGRPALGVVFAPIMGECFRAVSGGGAFLNDSPIKTSSVRDLRDAVVATGFPYEVKPNLAALLANLKKVLPETQGLRRLGSAALDLCYVACGRMDAYYEAILKPWDMAAGWLIVEEAGGKTTAMDGTPTRPWTPLLASNGPIHDKMLDLLNTR